MLTHLTSNQSVVLHFAVESKEFKKASKKFINCAATSPCPVKMTSLTMNSATFVRTDNTWSLPIYFTKSEHPSWSKAHHCCPTNFQNSTRACCGLGGLGLGGPELNSSIMGLRSNRLS